MYTERLNIIFCLFGFLLKISMNSIKHFIYRAANTQTPHIQNLGGKHPCNIHAIQLI